MESCTQALSDLALRFGEDDDEEGGMVSNHARARDSPPALPPHTAVHCSPVALPCAAICTVRGKAACQSLLKQCSRRRDQAVMLDVSGLDSSRAHLGVLLLE